MGVIHRKDKQLAEYSGVSEEALKLAWWHVGRFLHSFANLEAASNELFEKLFNLNATFFLLLVPQLDFSRRLELTRLALGRKAVNIKGLIDPIRDLIEVRNIVAHSAFGPDDDGARNHGVIFDYVGRTGKVEFSERVQILVGGKPDESFISYEAFEDLDRRMKQLTERLWDLAGACIPLSDEDFDDETVKNMRDVLSQNVIPLKPNEQS
jgi:hypothetical protein